MRIFLLLILFFVTTISVAQLNISTRQRIDYTLDTQIGEFTKYDITNEVTLFEINKTNTVIKHITDDMSSNYYVTDTWNEDTPEKKKLFYTLKSDAGNYYMLSINYTDPEEITMTFGLINEIEAKTRFRSGVIFYVKQIFE